MAQADFSKYLKVKAETIERPQALPAGHYLATFMGWKTDERNFAPRGEPPKITPLVTCTFRFDSACDDVESPPEKLGQLSSKDYTLNDADGRGLSNLRRLAEDYCGVPAKGYDLDDLLDAAKGSVVKVFNEPRQGKGEDSENSYTTIVRVLNADD